MDRQSGCFRRERRTPWHWCSGLDFEAPVVCLVARCLTSFRLANVACQYGVRGKRWITTAAAELMKPSSTVSRRQKDQDGACLDSYVNIQYMATRITQTTPRHRISNIKHRASRQIIISSCRINNNISSIEKEYKARYEQQRQPKLKKDPDIPFSPPLLLRKGRLFLVHVSDKGLAWADVTNQSAWAAGRVGFGRGSKENGQKE
ncbi:hypothetical protein TESG_04704 [Trichophyton tonsurans CBS 112818]|uniref:Uncharacterized protein n=1 Tax=Trichophyton tonsurans (strain CBS 112818) TaxID=647933 RepID=F2S144_TRIT1|nr:hypothetical protein TESG_04704 [Trichophyton tonsurans CBS 112818]